MFLLLHTSSSETLMNKGFKAIIYFCVIKSKKKKPVSYGHLRFTFIEKPLPLSTALNKM